MSRTLRFVLPVALIVALTAVVGALVAQPASSATKISIPAFSTADLMKDPGGDYATHLGNLYGTAHSSLTEITPANVRNLKIAWHTELAMPNVSGAMPPQFGGSGAMPLASKGILFTEDTYDRVWATDGATGKTLWVYDPELRPYGDVVPYSIRGLAIGGGNVYLAQSNGVIAAIDGRSGHKVWSNAVVNLSEGLFFTAAPLYYDGTILTGTSGGDTGGRSVFFALDARTGKVLWRWNAIPAAKGDLGFETWAPPNERAWLGGGSLWSTPVVDPKLGFVYVSVGNPIPYVLGRPPGAEVPTNSIVALRIKTGEPMWQYQTIHHDIWDWDMSNSAMLTDFEYQGRLRNALIAVNKNGYAYVLDRSNGQPILPIPEVQQPQSKGANTWPTQPIPQGGAAEFIRHTIDAAPWQGYVGPDGKSPYLASDTQYPPIDDTRYTVHVEPHLNQWQHNSYDAKLGLFFNQISRSIVIRKAVPARDVLSNLKFGNGVFGGRTTAPTAQTPAAPATTVRLVAFKPAKNEIAWVTEYENNATTPDALGNFTGMVTTESGVLFAGRLNGYLEAYDSSNGKLLWTSAHLAARTVGAPMVFAVNGKESVGFFTGRATNVPGQTGNGSELYTFQLP